MPTKFQTPEQQARSKKYRELRLWKAGYLAALSAGVVPNFMGCTMGSERYADEATDYAVRCADNFVEDLNAKRAALLGHEDDDEPGEWPELEKAA